MNDYYLPMQTYAPVHTLHNLHAFDTPYVAGYAVIDDFGQLVAPRSSGARWYSLNT